MRAWRVVELHGSLYYAFVPRVRSENDARPARSAKVEGVGRQDESTYASEIETKDEFVAEPTDTEQFVCVNNDDTETQFHACDECNVCFPTSRMLAAHARSTHNDRYKCELCPKVYRRLAEFKLHYSLEHENSQPQNCLDRGTYACAICDYETTNQSTFNSHMSRKHSANNRAKIATETRRRTSTTDYTCDACDHKCSTKRRLKEHLERKHATGLNYQCEYCERRFKVKGDMRLHVRFKHKEGPIACDVCGKSCSNSNSLYVHRKWAHFRPKYECDICHRRMVTQENLDQHVMLRHERRETFVCEECGKSFNENHRLKQHMMTHTGDRPHDCHVCGKAFARRTAYRQHLLIHTGKRPYVCDICGKAFTQKPGLICHRKCHPGNHPPLPVVRIEHILSDFMKK